MKYKTLAVVCGSAILAAGCSTFHKSDMAALQGKWEGQAVDRSEHRVSMLISGKQFEFRDITNTNVWYKGSFSLREDTVPRQYIAVIDQCPFPQYVGKTTMAIYQISDGKLKLTGNEPGNPQVPAAFDAPDAARVELEKK